MTTLLLLSLAPSAFAHSTGMTGRSTTGCGSCHGATTATTTSFMKAASTTVATGSTTNITLKVSTTTATRTHAGLDPREKESLERRRFQVARAGAVPAGFAFRRLPDLWRHLAAY